MNDAVKETKETTERWTLSGGNCVELITNENGDITTFHAHAYDSGRLSGIIEIIEREIKPRVSPREMTIQDSARGIVQLLKLLQKQFGDMGLETGAISEIVDKLEGILDGSGTRS